MGERNGYPHGVPCWTTCLVRDISEATAFYGALFGWDFSVSEEAGYAVATLRGRQVAGLGTVADAGADAEPAWITEVRVDSAAQAADRAVGAGGRVLAGPMDLAPAGTLSVLADPAGAVITAFEPGKRIGAESVNEPGAWAMSMLVAPDPAGTADFYAEVFGWQYETFGPAALWRLPGYVGGEEQQPVPRDVIAAARADSATSPRWDVDFWIADADAAAQTAERAGGAVITAPADLDGVPFRQTVLADPGGAVFSVSQLRQP